MEEKTAELGLNELEKVTGGAAGGYVIHKVRRGETLGKIARDYHTSVNAIMALNPIIKDPDRLQADWELKIPRY